MEATRSDRYRRRKEQSWCYFLRWTPRAFGSQVLLTVDGSGGGFPLSRHAAPHHRCRQGCYVQRKSAWTGRRRRELSPVEASAPWQRRLKWTRKALSAAHGDGSLPPTAWNSKACYCSSCATRRKVICWLKREGNNLLPSNCCTVNGCVIGLAFTMVSRPLCWYFWLDVCGFAYGNNGAVLPRRGNVFRQSPNQACCHAILRNSSPDWEYAPTMAENVTQNYRMGPSLHSNVRAIDVFDKTNHLSQATNPQGRL